MGYGLRPEITWDFNSNGDMIRADFFENIKNRVKMRIVADDLVTLSWSFRYEGLQPSQRTIFESLFRIVPEVVINNQLEDMSLGLNTFEQSMKPLLKQWHGVPSTVRFKDRITVTYLDT